jgi:hypothetical protein
MAVYPAASGRCKGLCDPAAADLVGRGNLHHQSHRKMAAKARHYLPAGVRQP